MLLLLFATVLKLPIVWRCTYGFCTILVDRGLLFYALSILLCNNGILLRTRRTGYFVWDDVRIVAANRY